MLDTTELAESLHDLAVLGDMTLDGGKCFKESAGYNLPVFNKVI